MLKPGGIFAACAPSRHDSPEIEHFAPREDAEAFFTEAGFDDVHVRIDVASVRFGSVGQYVATYLGATPLGGVLAGFPEATRDALVADVSASLGDYLDDDGLTFPQETHVATARN